jgi:hypothetical protein
MMAIVMSMKAITLINKASGDLLKALPTVLADRVTTRFRSVRESRATQRPMDRLLK